jgi:hypothetical protein
MGYLRSVHHQNRSVGSYLHATGLKRGTGLNYASDYENVDRHHRAGLVHSARSLRSLRVSHVTQ